MTSRTGDPRRGRLLALLMTAFLAARPGPLCAQAPADGTPEPLRVLTQLRPSGGYVGQAIELAVGVAAQGEAPTLNPPRLDGAELTPLRTDLVPLSLSGIGDVVAGENLYRSRYRIVPLRPGVLTVPPFSARLGERKGASRPLRIQVRPLPAEDRPPTFLGGVGAFEVTAEAVPASVRTGRSFEYRVTIQGPAARGSKAAPDVARLARVPLGLEVARGDDLDAQEPPSHTFIYRVRATRAGTGVLPPLAVSAFDPGAGRYVTKVTAGVPVRVSEVPQFDPGALAYGPATPAAPGWNRLGAGTLAVAALVPVAGVVALVVRRYRRDPRRQARRLLRGVTARLGRTGDASRRGQVLTEGLADYLRLTTGRPTGVLTPDEAVSGVARATGRDELGREAGRLVALSDAARFGPRGSADVEALARDGAALLHALAASSPRPTDEHP